MKKVIAIHPFLFAIFPVIFLFSHNIEQLSFSEPLLPTGIILASTLLLVFLSGWIIRDNLKAGLLVSIFWILFFSYGHAYDLIRGWRIAGFDIGRHRYLLFIWVTLFACGAYLTVKSRKDFRNFTNILNAVALSLVLISLVQIGVYRYRTKDAWQALQDENKSKVGGEATITDSRKISKLRDIYYIILDGYAGPRSLEEIYNFDNGEFIDYLTSKGFYVASESRSNYVLTFLSLASSMNMEYINYLTDKVGLLSKDRTVPYEMIKNSKVMNFLKSKGYKFIHFSSGWGATDYNKYADWNVKCSSGNEFLMVLFKMTMLRHFTDHLVGDDTRARILCTFSELAEIHSIEGPKFIFAHINSPHPPYVFGANGESIPDAEFNMSGSVWGQKKNYLNQLIFISKKVERLVDTILLKSEVPPIIILQADHGTASTYADPEGGGWKHPTQKMLKERIRIFNAYHLPSDGHDLLYNSVTPVNTFRLIFNFYFHTNYELLNDLSYYSTYKRPYKLVNVTPMIMHR